MIRGFCPVLIGLAGMPLVAFQVMAVPVDPSAARRVPVSSKAFVQLAQAAGADTAPATEALGNNIATPTNGPPVASKGPSLNGKAQRKGSKPQTNNSVLSNGNGLSTNTTSPNGVVPPYTGQLPNGGLIPDGALMPSTGVANGGVQPNPAKQSGTSQANGTSQYGAGVPANSTGSGAQDSQSYYTRRPLGASPVTRDITGPFGSANGYDARGVYTGTAQQPYAYGQVYATTPGVRGNLRGTGLEGTGPMRSLIPSPTTSVRANSGYGLPNGSRPMHMDARGIQRYD